MRCYPDPTIHLKRAKAWRRTMLYGCLLLCMYAPPLTAQDELLDMLKETEAPKENLTYATFKGTRVVNGPSVETRRKGELEFLILHRFGRINGGLYEFFGLDEANVRIALEYGLGDRVQIGLGRNSFEKTLDGYVKYQVLRQQTGLREIPVTASLLASAALNTLRRNEDDFEFRHRMAYTYQALVARKFGDRLSLQLSPTLVHYNLTPNSRTPNDLYALGVGGRFKLSQRIALNTEYYYRLNAPTNSPHYNALAIGFDIETGGHVFQLHFTNARAMLEKGFIGETTGNFWDGDIHFGFNIVRTFELKK